MDKKSRLKEELRLIERGRDFLENVELPKHTNSLPIKADDRIKPYKKVDAILIPEGATNGDMIKTMYQDAQIDYHEKSDLVDAYVTVNIKGCDTCQDYSYEWWNAQYKKGE